MTDRTGWKPALSWHDKHEALRKACDIVPCFEQPGQPGSCFTSVKQALYKITDQVRAGTYPYKATALDNLTSLSDSAMRNVLHNSGLVDNYGSVKIEGQAAKSGVTGIGKNHWGVAMTEVENILNTLRNLPQLVFLIAHDETEIVDGQAQKLVCTLGQKLPPKVPTYFDEIWYIYKEQHNESVKLKVRSMPSFSLPARSRDGLKTGQDVEIGMVELLRQIGIVLPPMGPIPAAAPVPKLNP